MIRYSNHISEKRKIIDANAEKILLNEQNNKCMICALDIIDIKDHKNYEVDHIIPLKSIGKHQLFGNNDIENLQLLCKACHNWKTREFEKKMLVSILQNNDNLQISRDFLLDKEFENYIQCLLDEIYNHLYEIDNDNITDIETYIKKYREFFMNKINKLDGNNSLRSIYSDEYIDYIGDLIYSFIEDFALLDSQYENKLYDQQEYIYLKNKCINFYIILYERNEKNKSSTKKKNNKNLSKELFFEETYVDEDTENKENTCTNSSLFLETCVDENSNFITKKRKRTDSDSDYESEIFTKKRKTEKCLR
jgi:hypothetical protein